MSRLETEKCVGDWLVVEMTGKSEPGKIAGRLKIAHTQIMHGVNNSTIDVALAHRFAHSTCCQ